MAVASPISIGVKQPIPDTCDPYSMFLGILKRAATLTPQPNMDLLAKFSKFVTEQILPQFEPLDSAANTSVPFWLDKTPYTLLRRMELQEKFSNITCKFDPKHYKVKCFIKAESYNEYKYPRGIYSRTDEYKTCVGPIFKLIEEVVFKHKVFIKKIPILERPSYLKEMLEQEGLSYLLSDFKAFESHFIPIMMACCEYLLYAHMVQNLPDGPDFLRLIREAMMGENECIFRYFTMYILGTRMSGEMNTSLGNGFFNWCLMMFIHFLKGLPPPEMAVEGDDGVTATIQGAVVADDFKQMGMSVEMNEVDKISETSFCGMVYDPDELITITSPIAYMVDFFWLDGKYVGASERKKWILLRTKALSALYQYPHCPIIHSMARYVVRMSEWVGEVDLRIFDTFKREAFLKNKEYYYNVFLLKNPTKKNINTKFLIEKLYNIPVEHQNKIDNYFDNLNVVITEIPDWIYSDFVHPHWVHYFDKYSEYINVKNPDDINYSPKTYDVLCDYDDLLPENFSDEYLV